MDIGCGRGYITSKIKQYFPEADISGLDYSISAIKYAVSHISDIDFIVANAYNPPYLEKFYDLIICNNLWEHVPDPLLLLSGISKILKPGGHLILSTPSRYRLGNVIRVICGKPIIFMSELHITEYSVGQVIEQLKYGNYYVKNIKSEQIGPNKNIKQIIRKIFLLIIEKILNVIGSHHSFESTVFFLAQKEVDGN